jgi:hypothetical protein
MRSSIYEVNYTNLFMVYLITLSVAPTMASISEY